MKLGFLIHLDCIDSLPDTGVQELLQCLPGFLTGMFFKGRLILEDSVEEAAKVPGLQETRAAVNGQVIDVIMIHLTPGGADATPKHNPVAARHPINSSF